MFHCKWNKLDQAEFLIRVSHCLAKGYTLYQAIQLQAYEQKPWIKQRIQDILTGLESGEEIAVVFAGAGFSKESCSFLYYALFTGDLVESFHESGKYLKLKEQQKKKFRALMRYPLFLMWLFFVMMYIVIDRLLPSFEQLYRTMAIPLPAGLRFFMNITKLLGSSFPLLLLILASLILIITLFIKRTTPQKRYTLLSKIPYFSSFLKMYLSYYFSFHLGSLLRAGLSISRALELIAQQPYLNFFKREADAIQKYLENGHPLVKIISERPYFTRDLALVILNGEAEGQVGRALQDYSQILFKNLEEKITRAFQAIQPIFFVLFGGLIIGLFLSILSPMFTIINGL